MRRLALLLLLTTPLFARTLHWKSIDVDARVDRDGNVHVVERQVMVFDGDWNGGERNFNLRPRQKVSIQRIVRDDTTLLAQGDLGTVDRWDWSDRSVVRWRSRNASDPPFANQQIAYRLEYTYSNVLVPLGGGKFELDHDFGLPNREGIIERFTLNVQFDPIWGAIAPIRRTQTNVVPGESAPVTQELVYSGATAPAGVEKRTPQWVGWLVLLSFLLAIVLFATRFHAGEKRLGRFAPIESRFDESVLKMKPEVAGAAWDNGVEAPEVAAVLARLAQEKKISSSVEKKTLYMKLLVDRSELHGYERELVDKLFHLSDETDTDSIRKRYRSTGFNPSETIRPGIEQELEKLAEWSIEKKRFRGRNYVFAFLFVLVALVGSAFLGESDIVMSIFGFFACVLFGSIAIGIASMKSGEIVRTGRMFIGPVFFLTLASVPLLVSALWPGRLGVHAGMVVALLFFTLWFWRFMFDVAKIKDTTGKIALRKRIAGTREFFVEELRKPQPALRDPWYPYLLAFGLGKKVDRWFRAHGAPSHSSSSGTSSWSGSSSSSSSSSSGWTGGGGAFGGAGASGSWAIAAGAIASGVATPGSSSSGSSGGGGSSSGGGGGGGW